MNRRFRVFVDGKLQGALCLRIAFYWIVCQATVAATVFGFSALGGGNASGSPGQYLLPALMVSGLVLPVAWFDLLNFSNRFVGPVYRIRKVVQQLADGEETSEIHFRKKDFYRELENDLNRIREKIQFAESHGETWNAEEQLAESNDRHSVEQNLVKSALNQNIQPTGIDRFGRQLGRL